MYSISIRYFFRSCLRHKLFNFINISGLAFAIAFIILIGQFIYHEYSYNRDLKDADNIYRLVKTDKNNQSYSIDYLIKDEILGKIPSVKNASIMSKFGVVVNKGKNIIPFDNMLIVDKNFLETFDIAFIHGDKSAIDNIDGVILTKTAAKKIFGETNVIGKSLLIDFKTTMFVTGVIEDLPQTLSLKADLLLSYENSVKERISFRKSDMNDVVSYPFNIFIQLKKEANISKTISQIEKFHKLHEYRFPENVTLVPFKTNYFNVDYYDYDLLHGNIRLVKILLLIGIIILILAVINFINLTTAGYKHRLTEVGIKKCVGAGSVQLKVQLMVETFLICLFSSFIGIGFAEILLPYFNQFIDKQLQLQIFTNLNFTFYFISFIIFLSLFAGFFPAIILSKITPLQLFKQNLYLKGTGRTYRNILTVFQFAVSIVLIFCLLVISLQIKYVKHKDLGFNTEQLLYIPINKNMADRIPALNDKFRQYPGIKNLSLTMGIPGRINLRLNNMNVIAIDSAAIKTFGFKIIEGRNMLGGDFRKSCFVNETAKKQYKDDEFENGKFSDYKIVGVISDFHIASLYNKNEPVALIYTDEWRFNCITIRASGPIGPVIKNIKNAWKKVSPDYPIDIQFYDEYFASMYRKEENLAALLGIFCVLAVVISCMGILGLAVFQAQQKIKEIGIRKVLGAASYEITYLLTKNFIMWVIISNILAIPIAYYFMNKWLQDFAYRIDISWWMFIIAGGIALLIALATVSFQAVKAAIANPVESLRYE